MADMMDTVEYLAAEIGPRPAATEEEQQAALYIAERFEQDAHLQADVEEFSGAVSNQKTRMIYSVIAVVITLLSFFVSALTAPAVILTLACLVLIVFEELGKPVLSPFIDKGVSQNVVAKYTPAAAEGGSLRRRKVIVVTRYDSGLVKPGANGGLLGAMPVLSVAPYIGAIALPILLIIKALAFADVTGGPAIFWNLLIVIAMLASALPAISFIMDKTAGYNDAANSNASGVALMLEVAQRVNSSEPAEDEAPVIHGQRAVAAAGLIPDGAEIAYEAKTTQVEPAAPEVVIYEGSSVVADFDANQPDSTSETPATSDFVPAAVAAGVAVSAAAAATVAAPSIAEAAVAPVSTLSSSNSNVPSWFAAGRAAAHPAGAIQSAPIKKSRYAEALDAFENRSQGGAAQSVTEAPLYAPAPEPVAQPVAAAAFTEQVAAPVAAADGFYAQQAVATEQPLITPAYVEREVSPDQIAAEEAAILEDSPAIEAAVIDENIPRITLNTPAVDEAPEAAAFAAVDEAPDKTVKMPMDYFMTAAVGASSLEDLPDFQPVRSLESVPSPITLPELSATASMDEVDTQKQRAPLAQASESGQNVAKSLLTMLPSIDPTAPEKPESLAATIPSLSGELSKIQTADSPSSTGSIGLAAGATGTFAPVTASLVQEAAETERIEDLFVEDADDSDFEQGYTETGAFAGAGYVEMPKHRRFGIFDRLFSHKSEEEDVSTNDWLGVDDDFEARSAGAARGSWESFREEDEEPYDDYYEDDQYTQYSNDGYEEDSEDDWKWNGGAFSNALSNVKNAAGGVAGKARGAASKVRNRGAETSDGYTDEEADYSYRSASAAPQDSREAAADEQPYSSRAAYTEHGAKSSDLDSIYAQIAAQAQMRAASEDSSFSSASPAAAVQEQVYNFRASGINTEVWFVALGAEYDSNEGMKAFIRDHASELRGATFIELESMGDGQLCYITKEGVARKVSPSSRIRRIINKAQQAAGVSVDAAEILWKESASSVALKMGHQAMHLAGMDGIKPAGYAAADDTVEMIDPEIMQENANFVAEMIKAI